MTDHLDASAGAAVGTQPDGRVTLVLPVRQPVRLPSRAELVQEASAVELLRRLRAFAVWAGEGRRLTAKGNLTLADGRQLVGLLGTGDRMDPDVHGRVFRTKSTVELRGVDFAFRLARAAGFVEVDRGRVRATACGRALGADPVEDWHKALVGLLRLGVLTHRYEHNRYADPYYKELVESGEWLVLLLSLGTVPFDELASLSWERVQDAFVLEDLDDHAREHHRLAVVQDFRWVVDAFADLGAVTVVGVELEDLGYGLASKQGGVVALTALGVAGAHHLARHVGLDVPTVGAFTDADTSRLLCGIAHLDDEQASAELSEWLIGQDETEAARQVVAVLSERRDDSAVVRAAFRVLNALPLPRAVEALRALALDERLGLVVDAWALAHVAEPPLEASLAHLLAIGTIERQRGVVDLLAKVGGTRAQCDRVERLRGEGGAMAVPVLEAVAEIHEDKRVAKAARRALFRLRTAGVA